MGAFKGPDGVDRKLLCRCLVGRSSLSQMRIESPIVSAEHAVVFWNARAWRIRDLASCNGTFVNGTRLASGQTRTLGVGDRVGFGTASESWTLSNDDGPQPAAVLEGHSETCFGSGGLLLLPDEREPEAAVYVRDAAWIMERAGVAQPIQSGDSLSLDVGRWVLMLPDVDDAGVAATGRPPLRVADSTLEFVVSTDEERVALSLRHGSVTREVASKACLYVLLTLARHRVASPDEPWIHVEDLSDRLRCTREKLNVDIHRIRRLFEVAGVADPGQVIERRNLQELRCGGAEIRIARQ